MNYEFAHLKDGFENTESGLAEKAWIAIKRTMDAIASPAAPFALPGDSITITGDHTFSAGNGFLVHQLAPQKNELDYSSKGDAGSMGFNGVVKIFIPGSKIQVHEQVANLMNTALIVLVKDPNFPEGDQYYQLGNDMNSAWLQKTDWKSFTTKDGSKGYIIEINYDGGPLFYKGVLTLKP